MNPTTIDYSDSSAFVFVCDYLCSVLPRNDGDYIEFWDSDTKVDIDRLTVDLDYLEFYFNRFLRLYVELYNEDYINECASRNSHCKFWIADAYYEHNLCDYEGKDKFEDFIDHMTENLRYTRDEAYMYYNLKFDNYILRPTINYVDDNSSSDDSSDGSDSDSEDSDDSDDSDIDPVV